MSGEPASVNLTYLGGPEVERLALSDGEILAAVEAALRAQGQGRVVIEPRVHLVPESSDRGHFNVLRGVVWPLGLAGVKVVGDFVENYRRGLPSEIALLNLFDPETGMPKAIVDATAITEMRTGAVTTLGARYLARRESRVLGHIGARGTAYWNVRLLDSLFHFDEIRVHSRRPESRNAFAERLSADLGKKVAATADWESCIRGADIVVEASRLPAPALIHSVLSIGAGAGRREASTTISAPRMQDSQSAVAVTFRPRSVASRSAKPSRLSGRREWTRISSKSNKCASRRTFQ